MMEETDALEVSVDPTLSESVDTKASETSPQTMGQKLGLTHPFAAIAHVLFKALALIVFLIFPIFCSFIVVFIVVILFLAVDFWISKNVSGRLLVGLRWWNQIKEDGTNEWIFESLEGQRQIHKTEMVIFWSTTLLFPIVWAILAFAEFITLTWSYLTISLVALSFSASNAAGYLKCARQARQQVTQMVTAYVTEKAVQHITEKLTESAMAATGSQPQQTASSSSPTIVKETSTF